MLINVPQAVADLKGGWFTLNDIDKATQIAAIIAAGTAGRALARELGVSEGIVRHLALANEAVPQDKQSARNGQLSTNHLVRRVKAQRETKAKRDREAKELQRERVARRFSKEIVAWLAPLIWPSQAEQVIQETRRIFQEKEETGKLPTDKAPDGMPLSEIIARCRPPRLETDQCHIIHGYAVWLYLWVFYAVPDHVVRDRALSGAWCEFCRH